MSGVADNTHVGWKQMPGQPRLCEVCGMPIVLARGGRFHTIPWRRRSRHLHCRRGEKA